MIVLLIISAVVPAKINSVDPSQLHIYPNYLFVYSHHFLNIGAGTMTVVLIYYFKNRKLWTFYKRQCTEFCEFIKEKITF